MFMYVVGGILLCIFLVLLMKITMEIHCGYHNKVPTLYVKISILFVLLKKKRNLLPLIVNSVDEEKIVKEENISFQINDFIKKFDKLHTRGKKLLKSIRVQSFNWNTSIGLGEAELTGLSTGILFSLKGILLGILTTYVTFSKDIRMNVTPIYQGEGINSELNVRLSFRLGKLIILFIPIYFILRRIQKEKEIQLEHHLQFE